MRPVVLVAPIGIEARAVAVPCTGRRRRCDVTPQRASALPREQERSASHLPVRMRREAGGGGVIDATGTRRGHRRRLRSGRSDRRAEIGEHVCGATFIAAIVFSTTPALKPRQPACATPTTVPCVSHNSTGRQSAIMTAHTVPGLSRHTGVGFHVLTDVVSAARRACHGPASATPAHVGSAARNAPVGSHCPSHHRPLRIRGSSSRRVPVLTPPLRVVMRLLSRWRGAGQSGTIQSCRGASRRHCASSGAMQAAENGRRSATSMRPVAACRMLELKPLGMQRLARECAGRARRCAACRTPDRRPADGRSMQVHADLVRAAGFEPAASSVACAKRASTSVVRDARACRVHDRHARALRRVAADRRIDGAARVDAAMYEREVFALARFAPAVGARDSVCARSVFATTSRPLVSLSSRCTMPARGSSASCGECAAARSAACRSSCRCPDARRGRPACRSRAPLASS